MRPSALSSVDGSSSEPARQCSSRFGRGLISALGAATGFVVRGSAGASAPHPDELRLESSGNDFGERPEATDRSRAYRRFRWTTPPEAESGS
jgi:hypothetical protein